MPRPGAARTAQRKVIDHVVPLKRGGANAPPNLLWRLLPACGFAPPVMLPAPALTAQVAAHLSSLPTRKQRSSGDRDTPPKTLR